MSIWAGGQELAIANFFFWRHGTEYQRSLKGLLRSLLFSILSQCPDLVKAIFPQPWERAREGISIRLENDDIKSAFEGLIREKEIYLKHKFVFFIDGLDEFQGRDSQLVQSLFNWVRSSSAIKVCVSSRELPIFQERFSTCPKFRLHELTRPDFASFVQGVLSNNEDAKTMDNPKDLAKIGALIVEKAEGVFLWVALVLKAVEEGLVAGDPIEELREKVHFLPSEVEDLFSVIFQTIQTKIHPTDRYRAMIIFSRLILRATTHGEADDPGALRTCLELRLLELSFLHDFHENADFSATITTSLSLRDIENRLKRCQKQVDSSCQGFATVVQSRPPSICPYRRDLVILSHRSLVEYLLKPQVRGVVQEEVRNFNYFQFRCQTIVAGLKLCASHLPKASQPWVAEFGKGYRGEIEALVRYYTFSEDASLPSLMSALSRLEALARSKTESSTKDPHMVYIPLHWSGAGLFSTEDMIIQLNLFSYPFIYSLKAGLYEYWQSSGSGENTWSGLDINDMLLLVLEEYFIFPYSKRIPDKLLRCFAFLLSNGLSPEAIAPQRSRFDPRKNRILPTTWQLILWHSVISNPRHFSPEPILTLFLVYGANPNCNLSFDASHGLKQFEGLISVMAQYGKERQVVFSPIFIPSDSGGIVDLARRSNWLVSFRDLVGFWFPHSAGRIQRLVDLNASRGSSPSTEELANLVAEYGLDPNSWVTVDHELPKPLFRTWSGTTMPLGFT